MTVPEQLPRLLRPGLGSATWDAVSPHVAASWQKGYEELERRRNDLEDDILRRYSVADWSCTFPESLVVVMRGTWDKLSESWRRIYLAILDADDEERRHGASGNKETRMDIYEEAFTCLIKSLVMPYISVRPKRGEADSTTASPAARTPESAQVVKRLGRSHRCLCCHRVNELFEPISDEEETAYPFVGAHIVPANFAVTDTVQGMSKLTQSFIEEFFGWEQGALALRTRPPENYIGMCLSCRDTWDRGRFAATAEELTELGGGVRVRAWSLTGAYWAYQTQKLKRQGSAVSVREWFRTYREPRLLSPKERGEKEWCRDTKPPHIGDLNADFIIKALHLHSGCYHMAEERRMAMDQLRTDGGSDGPLILNSILMFADFQYQPLHERNTNET